LEKYIDLGNRKKYSGCQKNQPWRKIRTCFFI